MRLINKFSEVPVSEEEAKSESLESCVQRGFQDVLVVLHGGLKNKKDDLVLQAGDSSTDFDANPNTLMFKFIQERLGQALAVYQGEDGDWWLKQLENVLVTNHWFWKCGSLSDYVILVQTAYKLFTGKCYTKLLQNRLNVIFGHVQADTTEEFLSTLRSAFNTVESIGDNPMLKKITSLYSYLLVHGFLSRFGVEINDEDYTKMERKALYAQYSSKKGLWMNVLDTTLFICERFHEWKRTGELSAFLHSGADYEAWAKEADRLLNLGPFTSNLQAHGTTYFDFIKDLRNAIERGEAYSKFTIKTSGSEVAIIRKKLMALQMLRNTYITREAAQQERATPFGVLVHGTSSVGKSTFTRMLFYYYGSLHGLNTDDHFRFVRSNSDDYWSNFDSSQWCIQLDDIAFLLPGATGDVDATLLELLNVINFVPFVPAQAHLEDKGMTPVRAELVLATSNAADLNAHEYFWCPLAVRRRLGYVIHVAPKEQYLADNKVFLDPTKVPIIDGDYPDFWRITVQKVTPNLDGHRDRANLVDVAVFESTAEFLRHFGEATIAHKAVQAKAMACDKSMKVVDVCKKCLYINKKCVCTSELELQVMELFEFDHGNSEDEAELLGETLGINLPSASVEEPFDYMGFIYFLLSCLCFPFVKFFDWFIELKLFLKLLDWSIHIAVWRKFVFRFLIPRYSDALQLRLAGRFNGLLTTTRRWRAAIGVLSLLVLAVGMYVTLRKKKGKPPQESSYPTQGNMHGTTEQQLEKEDGKNVWYNPTIELTKFDVPVASRSLAGQSDDDVRDLFARNCVRIKVQTIVNGLKSVRSLNAVFVKGHMCLTNNHAFRDDADTYEVTIIQMNPSQGLSSNITLLVRKNDLVRRPELDAVIFEVRCLPPYKDILRFWDHTDGSMFTRALAIRRLEDGSIEKQNIYALVHMPNMPLEVLGREMPITMGTVSRETVVGDCGALCIAQTPRGPIIYGLHIIGSGTRCGAVCINLDALQFMFMEHGDRFGVYSLVDGGGGPMLDLQSKQNPLTEPHHKSLFRYLSQGSMNIYGSFAGFRPRPRSKVKATPLREEMLEHFKCEVQHGPPCMEGWEPWRKNVVEMVNPTVNYQRDILEHCVDSFTDDILKGLPAGWQKDLVFLSPKASVNGLPGVKFIDRLNTNTSMGFPWGESKKRHLIPDVDSEYPEGVTFEPEVWERVASIEEKYACGKRAYPVFTGHLKDEPTAFKKIADKKTRVFLGGPVDWSIVVRSRLLSFVRLVQKNKFVFEAGPGTVCQSAEWGAIYDYITHFGTDRIIAGDYGKFDKRMISDFVLSAFRIIQNVYNAAGFSVAEVREIACIGEDTAFPIVNFNGDLVEFFGTNPSGHPLTVIVNSIVNSLYMRYTYVRLNPEVECFSFKSRVRLFTYGDDNMMGVSKGSDWFNHTAIQKELVGIGVEYTMADKESVSVPFVGIDDIQFLKRSWRYDHEVGAFMCPLELSSIHKSLTTWVPSGSIDEFQQMVAVISSAHSEFFFYGRDVFEEHHKFFRGVLSQEPYASYVNASTLPTWEQLVERFHQAGSHQQTTSGCVEGLSPVFQRETQDVQK
nr:MAG: hypothetical protein 1 [Marnaviridae sp.]